MAFRINQTILITFYKCLSDLASTQPSSPILPHSTPHLLGPNQTDFPSACGLILSAFLLSGTFLISAWNTLSYLFCLNSTIHSHPIHFFFFFSRKHFLNTSSTLCALIFHFPGTLCFSFVELNTVTVMLILL